MNSIADWRRDPSRPVFSGLRLMLVLSALAAGHVALAATVDDDMATLGASADSVRAGHPEAQPLRTPRRLPSGAVGVMRVPRALCEGLAFEQTLFFRHQQLTQIEMVWLGDEPGANRAASPAAASAEAFTALAAGLRRRFGPELSSASSTATTVMETASWVAADRDILLFRSGKADHPVVRLVVRQRQVVDAGQL